MKCENAFKETSLSSKTMFIYVDESGNFDFSSSGTKHFLMSLFVTSRPLKSARRLNRLKYELLEKGINLANFHASDDRQQVRDAVFREIAKLQDVSAHTCWIEKNERFSQKLSAVQLYEIFGIEIAKVAGVEVSSRHPESMVIVFDKALKYREEQAFLSTCKAIFSKMNVPFHIYFHNVSKDFNGQIADYIAWAHFVALERNEIRPLGALPAILSNNLVNVNGVIPLKK